MGVPSFYKWLSNKYPDVVVNVTEEKGEKVDSSNPNPNGLEFDNLYLDMNGIIHPCFHPDDNLFPPTTFEEVFDNVFEYIDRLFNIVRPRKLLYMAIDGVAPRAKMNQQRARRFQASKNIEIAEKEEERLRRMFTMEGKHVLPKPDSEVSDSNIITPGTEFMYKLSKKLQSYVRARMVNDSGWKDIKVILSDANVPGEGEHKIMSFIRLQRALPDYNPNTRHVLYGLDADLIMLALATHEVHFSILRENVLEQVQKASCDSNVEVKRWFKQDGVVSISEPAAFETSLCEAELSLKKPGLVKEIQLVYRAEPIVKKPFQFLNVWTLRQYLEIDMKIMDAPDQNFKDDLERIVDDFIFICFFAGNDFLPHMPTLEIHEGAIDLLMHVYKTEFKNLGGYLVDMQRVEDKKAGYIKLKRVEKFILTVGSYEEKIFKKRSELRERRLRRILAECAEAQDDDLELDSKFELKTMDSNKQIITASNFDILSNTKELKEKLRSSISKMSDVFKNGGFVTDKVKLGSVGWRERYYKEKLSVDGAENIECTRKSVVHKYTEGLCWVLQYYFSGVPSWTWFYPYHYGPFASDLKGLTQVRVRFQKGLPFKPFDQLMGVLPPKSACALPKAYRLLMTDENSNITDFYPSNFEVDIDGKRYDWQGICKLPFIDEERLLIETKKLETELMEDEAIRNAKNFDQLFVRSSSSLGTKALSLYENQVPRNENLALKIDYSSSDGIDGFIRSKFEDSNTVNPNSSGDDNVLCVFYELPHGCVHIPRLLEGVDIPEKTITEDDIMETELWHEYQGSRPSNRENSRLVTQKRNGKPIIFAKASSTNSSPEGIHKKAGVGWSAAGRGKERHVTSNIREQSNNFRSFPIGQRLGPPFSGSNSSWLARTRCDRPVIPNCSQNSNTGTLGFNNMRISESSQSTNYCGRGGRLMSNSNVWQSRNWSVCCGSNEWRQSVQSNHSAQGHGSGRGQHKTVQSNNIAQGRGFGRGQHMTVQSNNIAQGRGFGRGQHMTVQSNNIAQGRGFGRGQHMVDHCAMKWSPRNSPPIPEWGGPEDHFLV